jgi:hypothetical protein
MLDASMNMLGVSLQRSYGRSIMLGFHATYSLGGIVGASLAWMGAHWELALVVSYLPVVVMLLPTAFVGSRWYVDGVLRRSTAKPRGRVGPWSSRCCCRCVW